MLLVWQNLIHNAIQELVGEQEKHCCGADSIGDFFIHSTQNCLGTHARHARKNDKASWPFPVRHQMQIRPAPRQHCLQIKGWLADAIGAHF